MLGFVILGEIWFVAKFFLVFEVNRENPFCLFWSWSMGFYEVLIFFLYWTGFFLFIFIFVCCRQLCYNQIMFLCWCWTLKVLFCLFVMNLWLVASFAICVVYQFDLRFWWTCFGSICCYLFLSVVLFWNFKIF